MAITNGIPLINGAAYSWSDITCLIGGVPISGITAIDYSDTQVVENHYGAGRYPVCRSKGKIECKASITLEMSEVLAIQGRSLTGRLQDLSPFDIVVSYIPDGGKIVHDTIFDCQFKSNSRDWKSDNTMQTIKFDLVVSRVKWGAWI